MSCHGGRRINGPPPGRVIPRSWFETSIIMTATLPIAATSLRFAYSEPQDRLTLLAADPRGQGVHVALTRRLTGRIINGVAQLLERSNALAAAAPAEMRDDIILMEHQDALYGHGQAVLPVGENTSAAVPDLPPPRLVTAVDVTVTAVTFEIRLRETDTALIALSLDRLQVHRLVEALSLQAESAAWNIGLDAGWLEPGQVQIVLN